jgi:predicted HTH domain antitoxin
VRFKPFSLAEGVLMPLTIPDSLLVQAGWTEQMARLEIACRLFQTRRLSLWQAAQWAGLARVEMEAELLRRGIALYEVTEEQLNAELAAMDRLGIPG